MNEHSSIIKAENEPSFLPSGTRKESICGFIKGIHFADRWPKESRPVLLVMEPRTSIVNCIIASVDGPDFATFMKDGRQTQQVGGGSILKIMEPPDSILLEWSDTVVL